MTPVRAAWGRGDVLDRVLVWAYVLITVGALLAWAMRGWEAGLAATAAVAAGWVCVWAYRRHGLGWALAGAHVCTVLSAAVMAHPPLTILGAIVLTVLLGRVHGGVGVLAATGIQTVANVAALVEEGADDVVGAALISAAFTAFIGAVGVVLGLVERAMSLAQERGEQLERANARLAGSIVTERELALAEQRARAAGQLHEGLGLRLEEVATTLDAAHAWRERDDDRALALISTAATTDQEALETMRSWVRGVAPHGRTAPAASPLRAPQPDPEGRKPDPEGRQPAESPRAAETRLHRRLARWQGLLDVALAFGLVSQLAVLGLGWGRTQDVDPVGALMVVAAAACWWGYRARGARPLVLVLYALSLVVVVRSEEPVVTFTGLVTLVYVAKVYGWAGAVLAVAAQLTLDIVVNVLPAEMPASWKAVLAGASLVGYLLLSACGVLLTTAERLTDEAEQRGAALAVARRRLQDAVVTERELALAQERSRAARELHDSLGHLLTLVAMSLDFARRTWDHDRDRAWAEVDRARETNRQASASIRTWTLALDLPAPLTGDGGAAAFEPVARPFRAVGLDVDVAHRGEREPLPGQVGVLAIRVVQESLTNVLRHARAERAAVQVQQSPQQVRITVRDDGRASSRAAEGFGIRSLRERAEELGGSLSAGPVPGGGWEVVTVLPLGSTGAEIHHELAGARAHRPERGMP